MTVEEKTADLDLDEAPISTRSALRRAFWEAPTLHRGLGVTILLSILGTAGQLVVPLLVQQIIDNDLLIDQGPNLT